MVWRGPCREKTPRKCNSAHDLSFQSVVPDRNRNSCSWCRYSSMIVCLYGVAMVLSPSRKASMLAATMSGRVMSGFACSFVHKSRNNRLCWVFEHVTRWWVVSSTPWHPCSRHVFGSGVPACAGCVRVLDRRHMLRSLAVPAMCCRHTLSCAGGACSGCIGGLLCCP